MPEYLDPSIAAEGHSANGWNPDEEWQPTMDPPVIPTYKGIKVIAKYFPQFSGIPYRHKAFPAWLYHATEEPRLARTAEDAAKLGVTWVGAPDFRWECTGAWKVKPVSYKFDAKNPGTGKSLATGHVNAAEQQSGMIAAVVAAVMGMLGGAKPAGTAAIDPDRVEFEAFKAWKAQQAQQTQPIADEAPGTAAGNALKPPSAEDEKELLIAAAATRDIKIDKRWSVDRIKEALDKVE